MQPHEPYPIGTLGEPWGDPEREKWRAAQAIQRSYADDIVARIEGLKDRFVVECYGALPWDGARYPLYAVRTPSFTDGRPLLLITGGVHGYETSGAHGVLAFLEGAAENYLERFDILAIPCVSPWGYETINRWNPAAVDPNRSFFEGSGSPEAILLMQYVAGLGKAPAVHFDLHETTDTDNSEFRPALLARNGERPEVLTPIPDGFYTVAPTKHPELAFQTAVIEGVAKVMPIADPDPDGQIIGSPVVAPGIILYDKQALHLCGGFTEARYVTTTEVYPDSPRTDPATCVEAQVAAIRGGLDHLLAHDLV